MSAPCCKTMRIFQAALCVVDLRWVWHLQTFGTKRTASHLPSTTRCRDLPSLAARVYLRGQNIERQQDPHRVRRIPFSINDPRLTSPCRASRPSAVPLNLSLIALLAFRWVLLGDSLDSGEEISSCFTCKLCSTPRGALDACCLSPSCRAPRAALASFLSCHWA